VMNLSWVWDAHPEWRIPYQATHARGEKAPWYFRLSPDLPEVHRAAIDFYTDLAVYLPIDGVLFDDDAFMLPGERLNAGRAADARAKADAIDALLDDIRTAVRAWRPSCKFGRSVYAPVVDVAGAHPGFSQDLGEALAGYDLTVVMAYDRAEGHEEDAERWIRSLGRRALARWRPPRGREAEPPPLLLRLQAYDWSAEQWVPARALAAEARAVRRAGPLGVGLYPLEPEQGEIPARLLEGLPPESLAVHGPAPHR